MRILIFIFCLFIGSSVQKLEGRAVTNEDIRDAILSVVHMIRSTEDKLERHEYRERTLGDQLKKVLITIDKRQKLLDPVKGTLGRLDERLAAVETILLQKDERERIQMQKTYDMVEQIHRSLPQLFETLKNDIITSFPQDAPQSEKLPPPDAPSKSDIQKLQKEIEGKIDNISSSAFKTIEDQLQQLREESQKNNKLHESASQNFEIVKKHLNTSEQVLEKYENKLLEFNNRIDVSPKDSSDVQVNLLQALENQKSQVEQILSGVQTISSKIEKASAVPNLDLLTNGTFKSLNELKDEISLQTTKIASVIDEKFNNLENATEGTNLEIQKSVAEVRELKDSLNANIASSFQQLNLGVLDLGKLEKVIIQTTDGIQDTKRRIEYGVQQILIEVSALVKEQSKNVNASIKERFDTFELAILDAENGALANLTAKISGDIDQVWRQIGIMYQQISANSETLNKLEDQTDEFVNGTLNTMDNMGGKVGQITSRMLEVDDNLNYLLGRLSLVTHEFNQIKSGLGQALDDIKSSFQTVENKLHTDHPGPHQIPSNEINPDGSV